ncbi:hypothetical protein [Hymenobacter yonginensis]|uniref:Uncharacterized protein n=1 Tax=Hymenobacter yonginensis TaxID=748197 RepID=A0ABY7PIN2_9BACT|nr:hypothetical protein [Hymenobacter yonginensis]WBO83177.1 hypothetical protein O9Z63_12390 [Hymenobacter yonginensis]
MQNKNPKSRINERQFVRVCQSLFYGLTPGFIGALCVALMPCHSFAQASKDVGNREQLQILRQCFFRQQTWLMPSDPASGISFFQSRKQAHASASFITIPVVDDRGKLLSGSNPFFITAFVLKKGRCTGIITLNKSVNQGYITSLDDDFTKVYQQYLAKKSCFYFSLKHGTYQTANADCPLGTSH